VHLGERHPEATYLALPEVLDELKNKLERYVDSVLVAKAVASGDSMSIGWGRYSY
jgi:hypothetical protein